MALMMMVVVTMMLVMMMMCFHHPHCHWSRYRHRRKNLYNCHRHCDPKHHHRICLYCGDLWWDNTWLCWCRVDIVHKTMFVPASLLDCIIASLFHHSCIIAILIIVITILITITIIVIIMSSNDCWTSTNSWMPLTFWIVFLRFLTEIPFNFDRNSLSHVCIFMIIYRYA